MLDNVSTRTDNDYQKGNLVRDGIYKNLPLGRSWKSLLKSCERQKERGSTSRAKASRAVIADISVELSTGFISALAAQVKQHESFLPGFAGLDRDLGCRDLGGNNSPLENDVLASVKRRQALGTKGEDLISQALDESLENLKERRIRQMEQHCLSVAGVKSKPIISAARTAVSSVESRVVIEQLLRGQRPKARRAPRDIDPDEDLTRIN